jgi:hypothetical protein
MQQMRRMPAQAQQAFVPRYQDQPELAATIASDPTFSALEAEVAHERKTQAMKWWYTYVLTDTIDGQTAKPFSITIEQGTDFKCCYMTGSAFSYSASAATSFPIPTTNPYWAGRGLTMKITDTRAGRDLTSGELPFELIMTPGYGLAFTKPFPFHYWFMRNSKIRFDIRNLDLAVRKVDPNGTYDYSHRFSIALHGYKFLTPGS